MANGDPRDWSTVEIPGGKSGKHMVPLSSLILILGILLWFVRDLFGADALRQVAPDPGPIVEQLEVLNHNLVGLETELEEQTDLLSDNNALLRENQILLEQSNQGIEALRRGE